MARTFLMLFLAPLFLLATSLPALAQDAADQIVGEWEIIEVIEEESPQENGGIDPGFGSTATAVGFRIQFTDEGGYFFYRKEAAEFVDFAQPTKCYEVNTNAMPPQYDIIAEGGVGPNGEPTESILPCIYEINEEGQLMVAMGTVQDQIRPASFEPDTRFQIFKLRRVE